MSAKQIKLTCIALVILALGLDVFFAHLADKRIQRVVHYLDQHLSEVDLGAEQGKRYFERFGNEFNYYTFKTCLIRRTEAGNEKWTYTFHYARPYPILLGGMNRNSFRFKECGQFLPIKVLFDGTIQRLDT
ncbi:hypothetical protein [Phycobacter azelaicus]|uniref:hypothetical protein n=1 Tax=Phycobacter azelaicus TaxID=2668075 RepID=UPI001866E5AD|nr:hypothetical protein [Phycobacter azelaicus]MBE1296763.1 hypothetical protein [Paracoccaceae bacterium]